MPDNNLIAATVLLGGPAATMGMGRKHPMPTKDGRILVCMAQAGECRHNPRHYEPGMGGDRSWTLPQIEPGCDRRCGYRLEVADPAVDINWTRRHREYDYAGFEYYKRARDACNYKTLPYNHDAKTCPECSQPKTAPAEGWIDTVRAKLKAASRVEMSEFGYAYYYDDE